MSVEVEAELRRLVTGGERDRAATLAIASYGGELLAFLQAVAKDDDLGSEAFAIACEQLWTHLESFRWAAQLRTWFYQLGRNALHQLRVDPRRRVQRNLPLSLATSIQEVHRLATPLHLRSTAKAMLRELRERLAPEDHELLILRLDRDMSWKDVARALGADEEGVDARASALRKRYERLKLDLRELAAARGLVGDDS